jgi:hypothetical protein
MKKVFILSIIAIAAFASCKEEKKKRPDDALGTAREFIRSTLDGDYTWARELMLQDSLNLFELNTIEKRYKNLMSKEDKEGYKKASIIIHKVENVNDSIVIVNYSNSFKNKPMPIKVVLKDSIWQIDFNYTFTGNL